ncbi:MAG TPA: aminotransferase class III-fold pyridoxal phosphate-dependent enzyme, partial [Verrucomicrobiae bacterium]|nr:aminotransferase class III-fold pyridoxal phosphate-dependent enzyme [Verrucomicrobiae bacterium]
PEHAAELGTFLLGELSGIETPTAKATCVARGMGLMAGLELILPDGKPATEMALNAIKALLQEGYIFLPEGEHSNVIGFTPPLTITKAQLTKAITALAKVLTIDAHELDLRLKS